MSASNSTKEIIQSLLHKAKEAQKKGVRNISIITSLGSDSNSSNFYLKTKGLAEEQIRTLNFDSIFKEM